MCKRTAPVSSKDPFVWQKKQNMEMSLDKRMLCILSHPWLVNLDETSGNFLTLDNVKLTSNNSLLGDRL